MTSDRSRAYARVMNTIKDLGPAKLHELEVRRVRDAADSLIFAGPCKHAAFELRHDVEQLMAQLADCGRWTAESANALVDDLAACGPAAPDVLPSELAA